VRPVRLVVAFVPGGATDTLARQISNDLKEALGERLHTQVELMNPFRRIQPAGRDVPADVLNEMTPTASVAVGLALRKMGD
jgi:Tfp pilus assembly PilM family ATPase